MKQVITEIGNGTKFKRPWELKIISSLTNIEPDNWKNKGNKNRNKHTAWRWKKL